MNTREDTQIMQHKFSLLWLPHKSRNMNSNLLNLSMTQHSSTYKMQKRILTSKMLNPKND
jgi:hypothetical protein